MAKLIVEITSKDMIRPSSPTPNHLKTLQLSFRDQISPPAHMPYVFFYQSYTANSETTKLLKKSLSETLVQFYPLAGRVEHLSIDCNDEGVAFYEANVLASLVQVIGDPNNPDDLLRLLPFLPFDTNSKITVAAGVQVNRFSCGGVAIATTVSHKIADAATYVAFLNAWANKARGDSSNDNAPHVKFAGTSLFPQMNLDGIYDAEDDICKEQIVTRRLVFDKNKLESLKKQSVDVTQEMGRAPTNVQVVSAFIWKQFIKAARATPTPPKTFGASQVVNLRTIKLSPIPKNCCGNIYWNTIAHAPVEAEITYSEAVDKLRKAVKQIDKSFYLEKMQTGECVLEIQKANENLSQEEGDRDLCFFSDLTKCPFYQVNFGWGEPIWVSMTTLPFKNTVFFMGTKCGGGIEAWLNVLEQDVAVLEQDHQFLSLAYPNLLAKL